VAVIEVVPQGKLIPVDEESYNHGARVCRIGKDGMLYIALGQPHNVPPRDKLALYNQVGIGGIVRMNAFDGSKREVYARGIRNSVGMDFNPKDGTLWFTDNQTDGMGDDTPPGELNRITAAGQNFGYPWLAARASASPTRATTRTRCPKGRFRRRSRCRRMPRTWEWSSIPASSSRRSIRAASSTRSMVRGIALRRSARASCSPALKPDGTADKTEIFADGWLDSSTGLYRGRPVDVAVMKDGSLLISDDFAGAIYRSLTRAHHPKREAPGSGHPRGVLRVRPGGDPFVAGPRKGPSLLGLPRTAGDQQRPGCAPPRGPAADLFRGTAQGLSQRQARARGDERHREAAHRYRHLEPGGLVQLPEDRGAGEALTRRRCLNDMPSPKAPPLTTRARIR